MREPGTVPIGKKKSWRGTQTGGLYYLVFSGAVALGMACAPLLGEAEATKDDPCMAQITVLEGKRNLEILKACQGYTLDACPDVERINAHFDPLIQAQVRCGASQ